MTDTTTNAWTHTHVFTIPAGRARTFAALTDPVELRLWFAEHVDVDARAGGHFRFWGRHTYGAPAAPAQGATDQRITRFDRDRQLAFTWTFDGVPSEVAMELADKIGKDGSANTALTLTHGFERPLTSPYSAELVDDLWRLTIGNLDAHVRGGSGIVLPNYTDSSPEIRQSILIDAPRDRVFRALVDPAALDTWVARGATVDARVGGEYRWNWHYPIDGRDVEGGPTQILDLVPNERLVTDWLDYRGDTTRPVQRIAWLLETVGAQTRVTIVHSGFSRVVDQSDYPFGWPDFLALLKKTAEA